MLYKSLLFCLIFFSSVLSAETLTIDKNDTYIISDSNVIIISSESEGTNIIYLTLFDESSSNVEITINDSIYLTLFDESKNNVEVTFTDLLDNDNHFNEYITKFSKLVHHTKNTIPQFILFLNFQPWTRIRKRKKCPVCGLLLEEEQECICLLENSKTLPNI